MTWSLNRQNNKTFEFVNQDTNADIKRFSIEKDQWLNWKLVIECNDQGKEKIISQFGTDTLIEKFLNSESFLERKYIITDGFLAENTILAINVFYYILQEHRGLISKNFGFHNLFYDERKAGRLAITLAMQKGFDVGYQYAKKELERTHGESSCMEMLAEHSEAFAKEIAIRKSELRTISEISLINVAKEQKSHTQLQPIFFNHNFEINNVVKNMDVDVSDEEMATSAFGQGSDTAKKLVSKKFRCNYTEVG